MTYTSKQSCRGLFHGIHLMDVLSMQSFASGAIEKLLKVVCSTIACLKLLLMALIIVFTESKSLNKKIFCPPCDSKVNN